MASRPHHQAPAVDRSVGEHFSCSLSAVVIARVHDFGGDVAVESVLRRAGSTHGRAYLCDIANWMAYDEAVALLRAGALVTHHPAFAQAVGEDSGRRLSASPVAALLRSLGSPEAVYRTIAATAQKYSTVSTLEAGECAPGQAAVVARQVDGFDRSAEHCAWTRGLLATVPLLFGLELAVVEHETCAAYGADACHYRVRWSAGAAAAQPTTDQQLDMLRDQLHAMHERLHSVFQTAADLISGGDVDEVLARIADRAATEVRAPRHLLAVRLSSEGPLHRHHRGFSAEEADAAVSAVLSRPPEELPSSWLAVPIRSGRSDYGILLAAYPEHSCFLPGERELLEVYARYAASALDGASALQEAQSRYGQSSALLELARVLAEAGTSSEIARRLAESVPVVVDCDQVAVYVWDEMKTELVRAAVTEHRDGPPPAVELARWAPDRGTTLAALIADPNTEPIFIDETTGQSAHREALRRLGFEATIMVPLVSSGELLGMLTVAVRDRPERLAPSSDLLDRLSGVGAQASTALGNGRLVDVITHQALHDQLTGLANRGRFTAELRTAVGHAHDSQRLAALFYLDLDQFKPVNDELGHETGDALLVAVAQRLRHCTRADDVVARLGGDEFAVLVSGVTEAEIDGVAERLASGFDEPFEVGGSRLRISASIGRSTYPADAPDADGLLRRADEAMFAHKRGRTVARHSPAPPVSR
ncbi:MAG TPA: diguanylate cyclase [Solirubrobacteraceae bacterium]|nr:diguanylate cyclase [Solirubrobacteraceae bacterium]